MTKEWTLEEIDSLNLAFLDRFAREKGWEGYGLKVPEDDLALFFKHLPGNRVLDAGCGWGWYLDRFLKHGIDYVGIDLSPEMIKLAKEAQPSAKLEVMSIRTLTFPDESFDGIWCSCVLNSDPKRTLPDTLRGMNRVLAPGGILHIVSPFYDSKDEMLHDDRGRPFWRSDYEPQELNGYLRDAGFSLLESDIQYTNGSFYNLARK